jgi:ribosome assembly protein 1
MTFQVSPTLKVAVEPSYPADLGALLKGLKLLNQADPLLVYTVSQRGEHVLAAAGEVHLERCIKDLQERFAKVQLEVSKPLVSFKETIQGEGVNLMGSMKAQQGFVERTTPNWRFTVRVQVIRLPDALTKVLAESEELLDQIIDGEVHSLLRMVVIQQQCLGTA